MTIKIEMTQLNKLGFFIYLLLLISSCDFNPRPGSFHYTPKIGVTACGSYEKLQESTLSIKDSLFNKNVVIPAIESASSKEFVICFESNPVEVIIIQPINYGSIDTCYIKERYGRMESGHTTMWTGTKPSKAELKRIQLRLENLILLNCNK